MLLDTQLFEQMAAMEERHWWFRGRRRILHRVLGALPLPDGARVVDAGCGTGANAASLPPRYRVLGVDPTPDAIERARRFQLPHVEFACGSVGQVLEQRGIQADLVTLLDVIEHVQDDRALVADAVAGLRGGGFLVITVPADMRLWSPHDVAFGHYRRYDPDGLAAVLDGFPLEVKLLSHFNARLYPVIRGIRALRSRKPAEVDPDSLAGSDLRAYPGPVNAILEGIFAGEARRLEKALRGTARGYRRGASLMAVAMKTEAERGNG